MADRTTSTIFYDRTNPGTIMFKTNASNADYFIVPFGAVVEAYGSSSDDDDAIATFTCSGSTVTLALVDDAGANVTVDTDVVGCAILKNQ